MDANGWWGDEISSAPTTATQSSRPGGASRLSAPCTKPVRRDWSHASEAVGYMTTPDTTSTVLFQRRARPAVALPAFPCPGSCPGPARRRPRPGGPPTAASSCQCSLRGDRFIPDVHATGPAGLPYQVSQVSAVATPTRSMASSIGPIIAMSSARRRWTHFPSARPFHGAAPAPYSNGQFARQVQGQGPARGGSFLRVSSSRLAGAATMEEAKAVLKQFLPRLNRRFRVPAQRPQSAFQPTGPKLRLEHIQCVKHRRRVC